MEHLGALLFLASLVLLAVGLPLLIWRSKRRTAKKMLLLAAGGIAFGAYLMLAEDDARLAGWNSGTERREAVAAGFKDAESWRSHLKSATEAKAKAAREQERAAREAAEVEARKKREQAERETQEAERAQIAKDAACRKDIECWGRRHQIAASSACRRRVERLAAYDHKWLDGWTRMAFPVYSWADEEAGIITYIGDAVQFQNAFGAYSNHIYMCDFDPTTGAVGKVRASAGRF